MSENKRNCCSCCPLMFVMPGGTSATDSYAHASLAQCNAACKLGHARVQLPVSGDGGHVVHWLSAIASSKLFANAQPVHMWSALNTVQHQVGDANSSGRIVS